MGRPFSLLKCNIPFIIQKNILPSSDSLAYSPLPTRVPLSLYSRTLSPLPTHPSRFPSLATDSLTSSSLFCHTMAHQRRSANFWITLNNDIITGYYTENSEKSLSRRTHLHQRQFRVHAHDPKFRKAVNVDLFEVHGVHGKRMLHVRH